MTDFLTVRSKTWHFVRRVPAEFSQLDRRGIVRQSTRVSIINDRLGRRAARVAEKMNVELECFWRSLAVGHSAADASRHDAVRHRARQLGFDYIENDILIAAILEKRLERLEALLSNRLENDATAREAVLGTAKKPAFSLSRLFDEYEAATRDETRDFSSDQMRIWRNTHKRAVEQFVSVVGDKAVTDITTDDGMDYAEWWRERVVNDEVAAKTANRDIGQLSSMLKEMNVWRRLNLPDIFKGLRLKGETEKSRQPFDGNFIQSQFLRGDRLMNLNEDARLVLYVMIETGLRPSEIVNLQKDTIHLDAPVPYVEILPNGRRLKTEDSQRQIPLVGVAMEALKLRPEGFKKYRDRSTVLSATVNKYLTENKLRPTVDHTLYSLRHSFKDRLVAAEAPDSLIDSLMGHKTYKPKYGRGPSLELKLNFLERVMFEPPVRL